MIHEYGFAHIPQDPRRNRAWVASLASLAETRLAPDTTVPLAAFHRYHHLGEVVLATFDGPAQTADRPERLVAAQGLDHVVLQTHASGRARITAGGRVENAAPGDLVVLDLARPARIESEPSTGTALYLPRRILAEHAPDIAVAHGQVLSAERDPLARLVAGHLRDLAGCMPVPPYLARHVIPATLALCRAVVIEHDGDGVLVGGVPALGLAIRRFIEENLSTVDVPTLSRRFGLARASLYRRFPEQGGIAAYIRGRRLALAMRSLARPPGGRRPMLARLSHECGFADPRVFSRAFHRQYGLWPGEVTSTPSGPGPSATESPPMAWLREL